MSDKLDEKAGELWQRLLDSLEDKLQYGLLTQARLITDIQLDGEELVLETTDEGALQFFSLAVNQQRLVIASRELGSKSPVVAKVRVIKRPE